VKFKIAVLLPDMHIPFHDVRAFDTAIRIIQDLPKLDQLIIKGDFIDCEGLSLHDELPQMVGVKRSFEDEIYLGNQALDVLDSLDAKEKVFIEGNHEYRLKRTLTKKVRALVNYVNVDKELNLDKRGYNFIPFPRKNAPQIFKVLDTDVFTRHMPYSGGKNCAASSLNEKHVSLIFGHTHRVQRIVKKRGDGGYIEAISGGCLIDFQAPVFGYMDTDNWAHSITVVYQYGDNPQDYLIDQIIIKDGKAIYQGNFYESKLGDEHYYRNNFDQLVY
jgi:predicted phosphodiesterase